MANGSSLSAEPFACLSGLADCVNPHSLVRNEKIAGDVDEDLIYHQKEGRNNGYEQAIESRPLKGPVGCPRYCLDGLLEVD